MKVKKFEFNMFPVNCFVLSDETNEAVIIDAGCFYPEEKQRLKDYIESNGLTVKHVLNTHLHLDHVFGNPFLLQEYGLRPESGEQDEFWLAQASAMAAKFGFLYEEKQPALGKYLREGDTVTFDQVLAVAKDDGMVIGSPVVEGAKVTASVLKNGKAKKVIVYKYKSKKGYHKKQGHRQPYTKVQISAIEA